jgi:hypothetical protein
MTYSEFMLTVIAILLFFQLFRPTGAKERKKLHEALISQLDSLETALKDAIEESTCQVIRRQEYVPFEELP